MRDHSLGGSSDGGDRERSMAGSVVGGAPFGYTSGAMQTDTESARLSNVQPYKFNQQNRNNPNSMNIRKINPKPITRGSNASRGDGIGAGLKANS